MLLLRKQCHKIAGKQSVGSPSALRNIYIFTEKNTALHHRTLSAFVLLFITLTRSIFTSVLIKSARSIRSSHSPPLDFWGYFKLLSINRYFREHFQHLIALMRSLSSMRLLGSQYWANFAQSGLRITATVKTQSVSESLAQHNFAQ